MNVYFFIQLTKKKKRKEKVPGEKATCEARGLGRGAACLLGGELGALETPPKTLPEDGTLASQARETLRPAPAVGRGSSQPRAGREH